MRFSGEANSSLTAPAAHIASDAEGEHARTALLGKRRRRPRRPSLRRLLRAVLALGALTLALFIAGAVYVADLRGVGDARTRVQRILASHDGIYAALPPPHRLGSAVVAAEDEHFYANFIVNILDGVGRAALATLHTSGDPGGSTITQQLAKQLYGGGTSLGAVIREIGLAVKLSLRYSKAQILNMYLNAVYYGNGYWGDAAAARGYFGSRPGALSWAQAAMLAGLLQAPSAYDPLRHYTLAKSRQRYVLSQLVINHYMTRAEAKAAFHEPLHLR